MKHLAGCEIEKLTPSLGGVVRGFDLRGLIGTDSRDALLGEVSTHGVLVFRSQQLEPADFAAISAFMGELEYHVLDQYRMPEHPEVYVISNIVDNGRPLGNPRDGFGWHTDQSYLARPTAYTLLYGAETPAEGADTLFVDTRRALEQLDPAVQRDIGTLRGIHSYGYMRTRNPAYIRDNAVTAPLTGAQMERVPDVLHPLVRTNPVTHRRGLYLGGDCLAGIEGMAADTAAPLMRSLFEAVLAPEYQLRHRWLPGDVVIWDNRHTMHTATEYDRERYRRLIWRTSVRGEVPY